MVGDDTWAWTPYVTDYGNLNGVNVNQGPTGNANPGATAWASTITYLQPPGYGPGKYASADYHWFTSPYCSYSPWGNVWTGTANSPLVVQLPMITGVAAIWWLGAGNLVVSNGGVSYYAQSALAANPEGAPETPVWTVTTKPAGGVVSLNCSTCTSTVATSQAPSADPPGCEYDVTLTVNVGGFYSAPFGMSVNTPWKFALVSGFPKTTAKQDGFQTLIDYNLTDECGSSVPQMNGNEQFVSAPSCAPWCDDYYVAYGVHNNWRKPSPTYATVPGAIWEDTVAFSNCGGLCIPGVMNPQSPLSSVKVLSSVQWWRMGSLVIGSGERVQSDVVQFYVDHGAHNKVVSPSP